MSTSENRPEFSVSDDVGAEAGRKADNNADRPCRTGLSPCHARETAGTAASHSWLKLPVIITNLNTWTRSAEFRAAHRGAGQNKPLYIDHPQFKGFEVRQTVRRGAAA
jgi:hypothetical protein